MSARLLFVTALLTVAACSAPPPPAEPPAATAPPAIALPPAPPGPAASTAVPTPPAAPAPAGSTYRACGCGCCGGTAPQETRCLYRSKGDDLARIIAEDRAAAQSPSCANKGCALGVVYRVCD
jgi:hypothetical protein